MDTHRTLLQRLYRLQCGSVGRAGIEELGRIYNVNTEDHRDYLEDKIDEIRQPGGIITWALSLDSGNFDRLIGETS